MHHDYDYLIVGGGMVADTAANGIRERDESGTIGIVGEEPTAPFPRPALSKKLWTDPDFDKESAALGTEDATGATMHLSTRATSIDRDAKVVTADGGDTFGYGTLLLATGGHPRQLDGLAPSDRVLYFRTLTDYDRLRELSAGQPHVVVVGGGYIGSEVAAGLVQNDVRVTVLHPEQRLLSHMLPDAIAADVETAFADAGVTLRPRITVEGGETQGSGVTLRLDNGTTVEADAAVVGLGIEPAGELAADAGLETSEDGGIVVDEHLRTSDPHVLAAGDVAHYVDKILGARRVEHVDNANEMGAAAGRIMAGSEETYDHTPYFYSDLFDYGYEAVGTLDASLETRSVDKGDGNAVVYYLDGDEVVGVLLWGVWDSTDAAREVLARHARPDSFDDLI